MSVDHSTPSFTALADLASARVGGRAVAANDDFFASKANLVKPEPAIFIPGKFTARGKWMDGWESRRRRTPGHDWCVVRLGIRASSVASTWTRRTSAATILRTAPSTRRPMDLLYG